VTPGEGGRGLSKVSSWCHQREVKCHLILRGNTPQREKGGGGEEEDIFEEMHSAFDFDF